QPGAFAWMTWTGAQDSAVLVASLTPPGDSSSYVNPLDPGDRVLSPGDWIRERGGVANSGEFRSVLDRLLTQDVILPVWDSSVGQGSSVRYHSTGFIAARLTSYRLAPDNRISLRF